MFEALFRNITEKDKNDAIEAIIQHASPRYDFFLMMTLSICMAVFGVILGSTVILIGSMLVAPILYPLLSLALGIIASDQKLIGRSLYTLTKSVVLALAAAFVIGFLFAPRGEELAFAVAGTPSLMYAIVAAIAGFAAAFATTKPHLNDSLPGVAISVALVPPLAVAGIGFALFDWMIMSGALLLFLVNVIGILFSAMVVFALMRFATKRTITQEAVKEEEKVIEKEAEPAKPAAA